MFPSYYISNYIPGLPHYGITFWLYVWINCIDIVPQGCLITPRPKMRHRAINTQWKYGLGI